MLLHQQQQQMVCRSDVVVAVSSSSSSSSTSASPSPPPSSSFSSSASPAPAPAPVPVPVPVPASPPPSLSLPFPLPLPLPLPTLPPPRRKATPPDSPNPPLPPPPLRCADPLSALGNDLFLTGILPLLDALSLARCTAVCTAWRSCASTDSLWRPHLERLFCTRAHVPLPILRSPVPFPPFAAFSIIMRDAKRVELTPEQMCAYIWEMRVKPTCGPYWHSLDPTTRGETPLLRRFHCDQSVTSLQENDPIWGGQESVWQFVKIKRPEGSKPAPQRVQINRWPHHLVVHLPDGRWRLDNTYASYTTCPDREENKPPFLKDKVVGICSRCNPTPLETLQK